jgi:hypothetical protein
MRRFAHSSIKRFNTMPDHIHAPVDRDAQLERIAAELTLVAYRVALRTRKRGTWLDLQLDLWREMAETLHTWCREMSGPAGR